MSYADVILAEAGLVAYWRQGEPSGTNADDAGPNNLDGTYVGSIVLGVAGALFGDANTAANATIQVTDTAALDLGNGPLTLEGWIKRDSGATSTTGTLINKGTNAYFLRFNTTTLDFRQQGIGGIVAATVTTADTAWHHFMVTRDPAGLPDAGSETTRIYIDGVNVTGTVTTRTLTDTTSDLFLGASAVGSQKFGGATDEFAIYNVAKTGAAALAHYLAGHSLFPPAAQANAVGLVPVVSILVPAVPALGTASAPTPTPQDTVPAPAAAATASASAPTGSVTVSAPAAQATAGAGTPTVGVSIQAPAASATASAPAPTLTATVTAPAANATAGASAPTPSVLIPAPPALVSATAPTPTISSVLRIDVPAAQATASAPAPGIAVNATAPAANVVAGANSPTMKVSMAAPAAQATAYALAPGLSVTVPVPPAGAMAIFPAPSLGEPPPHRPPFSRGALGRADRGFARAGIHSR